MKVKTIDDALGVLNAAKAKYGNIPITIFTNGELTATDCLDIQYDKDSVTFYNC